VRLVFVTQTLDREHPVLAQTVDLVHALAARSEELVVLCGSVGDHEELPVNVRVRAFGAETRLGRGARFTRALASELGRPRPDAVLVHMVPLFLVLAAPLAKPLGVRLALWYTHWASSRTLRLATRLADVVLSVDRRSFPLDSPKVLGIGHAIDVARFTPATENREGGPLELVALGRTARWKGYATLLAGFRLALERGLEARLRIIGPSLTDDERRHRAELAAVLPTDAELLDPVPRAALPGLLREADALVSPAQSGETATLDKAVYEAAACGLPVVSSNPALQDFLAGLPLELTFEPRDAAGLADRLVAFDAAGSRQRAAVGAELRRRVVEGHSLDSWADAVTAALARLRPE
jgi:glycosyltransferase involved in cell wall biosynthesis